MATNERTAEDEYFAREEIEKQHKLAKELAAKRAKAEAEALKAAHYMKCPSCGNDLAVIQVRGVDVQRCFHCHGTFLTEPNLEKLAHPSDQGAHRLLDAVINVFRRPGKD